MADIEEPTDSYKSGGKLRECDVCGFTWREYQTIKEKGIWRCPYDQDKPSVKDLRKPVTT